MNDKNLYGQSEFNRASAFKAIDNMIAACAYNKQKIIGCCCGC